MTRRCSSARSGSRGSTEPGRVTALTVRDRAARRAIEEIFFETAPRRRFASPAARQAFFRRWTGFYLSEARDQVRLFRTANGRIAGYLTACLDSGTAAGLYRSIHCYRLFEPYFARYPVHFHVNCAVAFQRRGIGSALVGDLLSRCCALALPGIHVVTTGGAANVAFYRHLGFAPLEERMCAGKSRLLLGLSLL